MNLFLESVLIRDCLRIKLLAVLGRQSLRKIASLILILPVLGCSDMTTLTYPISIVNMFNQEDILPRNLRTSQDCFLANAERNPSLKGLRELQISGSGQFSEAGLIKLISKLKQPKLFIVDLRQEPHGFLNGMAISWYEPRNWLNKDKSSEYRREYEKRRLSSLFSQKHVSIYLVEKLSEKGQIEEFLQIPIDVKNVKNEEILCKSQEINYLHLPVVDHLKPSNEVVDLFINFIKNLDAHTWIHFHCLGGRGRTTTFMVMYDIMKNYASVSFEDILLRQWLIGGSYLRDFNLKSPWKTSLKEERILFLKNFYTYCKNCAHSFQESWSSWLRSIEKNDLLSHNEPLN